MKFLINNYIVSKNNNITKISPISRYNHNINNLINITTGNKLSDNDILQKLADTDLEFEDIIYFYQNNNNINAFVSRNIRYL